MTTTIVLGRTIFVVTYQDDRFNDEQGIRSVEFSHLEQAHMYGKQLQAQCVAYRLSKVEIDTKHSVVQDWTPPDE